jgi:hypothetical protein
VDPTAVADRIVEHLFERLPAPQGVEPSPPNSPASAPATAVSPSQESAAVQEPPQQTSPSPAPPKQKPAEQEQQQSEAINALETPAEPPSAAVADDEAWQLPQWQYTTKRARINQRQKRK